MKNYIGSSWRKNFESITIENWLLFLDEVIVWSIFAFILLLPLSKKIIDISKLRTLLKVIPIAAWVIKMTIQKRFSLRKNALSWPVLGYVVACLISLFHSVDILYSLYEIYDDVILPILLYLVIVNTIQQKHFRLIFWSFLISAMMVSTFGIWTYINGTRVIGGRAILTLGYPTIAGRYISVLITLSLGTVYIVKSWLRKVGVVICLLISVLALFLTQARGGILAGFLAFTIFAFLKDKRLLITLPVLMLFLPLLPQKTVDRAGSILNTNTYTDQSSTMYSRYGIWQASVLVIRDNWLWGVGYGWRNVRPILTAYRDRYRLKVPDEQIYHAHNLFLQVWLEIGLIGFIMFMWLVIDIFRKMLPIFRSGLKDLAESTNIFAVIAAICSLFVAGTINFFLRYEMVYLFWIIIGVFVALINDFYETYKRPIRTTC